MAETARVTCATGSYTAVSTGFTNVSFINNNPTSGRFIIATTLPAAGATNFVPVEAFETVELGGLAAADNVYFQPESGNSVMIVIRG